jgi:hypothetical protein
MMFTDFLHSSKQAAGVSQSGPFTLSDQFPVNGALRPWQKRGDWALCGPFSMLANTYL